MPEEIMDPNNALGMLREEHDLLRSLDREDLEGLLNDPNPVETGEELPLSMEEMEQREKGL